MDEIVRQAMAKWPNVPDCFGWLALDRRGQWRMRNEFAQANKLSGDPIRHAPLIDFIAFPVMALGGVQGRVFVDVAGAWFDSTGFDWQFWNSDEGRLEDAVAARAEFVGDVGWQQVTGRA